MQEQIPGLNVIVASNRLLVSLPVAAEYYAMRLIATLLQRVWQRQSANETDAAARFADRRDRSSMADFVRILQAQDRQHSDQNSS